MELLAILVFTLAVAKSYSISCEFCVEKNLTYFVLEDWDRVCSKSVQGRKVRMRLKTIKQCLLADRLLSLKRGSVSENVTATTASTSKPIRPNTEQSTVYVVNVTKTLATLAVFPATTTTTWTATKFLTTTTIPELTSTLTSETPLVSTTTVSSSAKTTQNYSVTSALPTTITIQTVSASRNFTVTSSSSLSSPKTIITTRMASEAAYTTTAESQETTYSSPPYSKVITTTPAAQSVYTESTVTPLSTRKSTDKNLYDRMWSSVIRSYTLLTKVERLYHNLTKPLVNFMESSPVYQLVNNKNASLYL